MTGGTHSAHASGSYRSDVDGLRAVAVLSVIVSHFRPTALPGGFVGVDVFFVISGFLITRNLLETIATGRFSLLDFYKRRVKRIVPALLVVVAATLVLAHALLLPEDARSAAKSAVFALVSLANVYFWRELDTGYFAASTREQPLLHLWSLGVEEQYYVVWPLLLPLLWPALRRGPFVALLLAIAALSFALGELVYDSDPKFAYYMLPTRAGELMLGAVVAELVVRPPSSLADRVRPWASLISYVSAALVLAPMFLYSEHTKFPGLAAVPPVVGTALLIYAGHLTGTRVSRMLSRPLFVGVGLISYSAYLWHWPIAAFLTYGYGEVPLASIGPATGLTFVLAWATYRYVERPARSVSWSPLATIMLQYVVPAGALGLAAVAYVYAGRLGLETHSVEYRARLAALTSATAPAYSFPYICQRRVLTAADLRNPACELGASSQRPTALLWGDSNAAHYVGIVAAAAEREGFRFRNVAIDSCPPLLGEALAEYARPARRSECVASNRLVAAAFGEYDTLIVGSAWLEHDKAAPGFLDAVEATLRQIADGGARIVILGQIPLVPGYDRHCAGKALSFPLLDCTLEDVPLDDSVAAMNRRLERMAQSLENAGFFDVSRHLCASGRCRQQIAGLPLYFDGGHFSMDGASRIGRALVGGGRAPPELRLGPPLDADARGAAGLAVTALP